ncbi:MAG: hydrogenase formation protein HypD [Bacteroidales bacterium]|nr:hydrogenase formation protein HypD [Bacteroidales bacterium]
MKYMDEYRDHERVLRIAGEIGKISARKWAFMEVCGGHTMAIQKFGIPSLLPESIRLLSGPGCPVCVSSRRYIDQAVAYSRINGVIIATFGDLIRVPGSFTTLEKEKAAGADIHIVYSILDALKIAREHRDKQVVFLAIGFETTAPGTAAGILNAYHEGLTNFMVYSSHKIMPPAMAALVEEGVRIDGYIAPGHVSTITGTSIYRHLPGRYGLGCVVSGFEPLDIMQSLLMLVKQMESGKPRVEIQYRRAVTEEGNMKAKALMEEVFETRDDWWRGLGVLPDSGLAPREKYRYLNAEVMLVADPGPVREDHGCICGEILRGIKEPRDCRLFGSVCTPVNPVGACMVSNEGACHAYYRYNRS